MVQYSFTSTETVRLVRTPTARQDGHLDSHTAMLVCTETFLQVMLNVLGCRLTYYGQAETNAEAWFNMTQCPKSAKSDTYHTNLFITYYDVLGPIFVCSLKAEGLKNA